MNSPGTKKIIVVGDDGSKEEVKRGIVSMLNEEGGVQHVFVGLGPGDFFEIVRAFVEAAVDVGEGGEIIVHNMLVEKMMADWLERKGEPNAGLQIDGDSQG